jgi:hypothetical protein
MTTIKKVQRQYAKGLWDYASALRFLVRNCGMAENKADIALRSAIGVL